MPEPTCAGVPPLLGHTVGITGDRRSEELATHLSALGATVVHGAMLRTSPIAAEQAELRAVTESVIAKPPDVVVATTGIGIRGWINAAASWGRADPLTASLRRARILARGPKAAGAVVEAGLPVSFTASTGRTADVLSALSGPLDGIHVVVQLPGAAMPGVVSRLLGRGAVVTAVTIYDWTLPDDPASARRLLRAIIDRRVAAVTFTSRPAVRNLVALASTDRCDSALSDALAIDVIPVCVGAATADALVELTGARPRIADRPLLGRLAPAAADALRGTRHQHLRTARGGVVVQGRLVTDGAHEVLMSDREAAVLRALIDGHQRTVSRDELLRRVWRDEIVDPSVVDTTLARLRRRVAKTGVTLRTVTGRGFLVDGVGEPCPIVDPLSDARLSAAIGR